jgi:ribosomal protein S17E
MFTTDFDQNKKLLEKMMSTPSKSLRNMIIGYVTRLAIQSQPEDSSETEEP